MVKSAAASLNTIEAFLNNVGTAEKRAAEANTEAGSIGGETEHPVKNVDDRTEPAKEGARSSENDSDVKEDQGKVGVNSTPEAAAKTAGFNFARFARPVSNLLKKAEEGTGGAVQTPGSASDDQLQIGTNKQPTGEDPSVETGSAKAGKEDPGSSHPARTDNDSLDGNKYASDIAAYSKMPLETLALQFEKTANALVAAIAVAPLPDQQQTQKQASAPSQSNVAHQAGWELAGLTSGQFDKKAADALVQEKLGQIIKTANDDADNVIAYYTEYANERQKLANDPMMDPAAAAGGAGGPPPGGGPGADQAMLDALGGGGGGGGAGGMPGGMGGGMGGDPMGGEAGGGAGGDQQGIEELLAACEQLQLAPGELAQLLMADAGGAGGDAGAPPPGGAGGPPPGGGAGGPPPGGEEEPGMEAQAGDNKKGSGGEKSAAAKGNTQKTAGDVLKELFLRSKNRR